MAFRTTTLLAFAFPLAHCTLIVDGAELFGAHIDAAADAPPADRAPVSLTASLHDPERVTLAWTPPRAGTPNAYRVLRDSALIATLGPDVTRYDDVGASAGAIGDPTVSSTYDAQSDLITVTWSPGLATDGAEHAYAVEAVFVDGVGTSTAMGRRGSGRDDAYTLIRDDVELLTTSSTRYDDHDAPRARVALTVATDVVRPQTAVAFRAKSEVTLHVASYRVKASGPMGAARMSNTSTSTRGLSDPARLTLAWERRAASEASFVPLPDVTGHSWYDATLPLNEDVHYRASVRSPWAESASSTTAAVRIEGLAAHALGATHGCGLSVDGRVACFGTPDYATGADTWNASGGAHAVAAGYRHTCAILRADRTLRCTGRSDQGQTLAPSGTFDGIAAGRAHTCAISATGTLTCWGDNAAGQSSPPPGSYRSVFAGWDHSCALDAAGLATCWGDNRRGQTSPKSHTFSTLALGVGHTCGITLAGAVECWGSISAPPSGNGFTAIVAGDGYSCALDSASALTCWGAPPPEPIDLPLATTRWSHVAGGADFVCGITQGTSRTRCWGVDGDRNVAHLPPAHTLSSTSTGTTSSCGLRGGRVSCWGTNARGEGAPPTEGGFAGISMGQWFACALRADGTGSCWGDNDNGAAPPSLPVASASRVVSGITYACALGSTGKLSCWGENPLGAAPRGPSSEEYIDVAVGGVHTCAVVRGGVVRCMGADDLGQSSVPTDLPVVRKVAAQVDTTCALLESGAIRCWGDDSSGVVSEVLAGSFSDLVVADGGACALRPDGRAACWGDRFRAIRNRPGDEILSSLSARGPSVCGLDPDGHVRCFGVDYVGAAPRL